MDRQLQKPVKAYFKKKGLPESPALTFADVVIRDNFSEISSRSDIRNLETRVTKNVVLRVPIVSANMDTVTDARMAITLARLGGLGFIHQFFSLEERVEEVRKVKRADNALIEKPVVVVDHATLGYAKEQMRKYSISSILVVDELNHIKGILTSRDYRFVTNESVLVTKVMKPMPLITAAPGVTQSEAEAIFEKHKLEKLPIVDENGIVMGLMSAKDLIKTRAFPNAARDENGNLLVGAALRLNAEYLQEAELLLAAGSDVLLLDTARANSKRVRDAVKAIKFRFPEAQLVVGNIDTPEAAAMLIAAGADGLKVGIGPGSACKTRDATGVGIPQVTAIVSCAAIARMHSVPIIADGGIKCGADLSKALVAGAQSVMVGSLFAGTDESPGEVFRDANQQWKMYRGSASAEHQFDRIESGSLDAMRAPEGVPRRVAYTGPVKGVIDELLGGLRSSMSYVGAHDVNEFEKFGTFVWQTVSGYEEGKPKG